MISVKSILCLLLALPLALFSIPVANADLYTNLEESYHGHLGHLSTANVTDHEQGMLEKWCALPNLTMLEDGFNVGAGCWMNRCGTCHIGGKFSSKNVYHPNEGTYAGNPVVTTVDCFRCHVDDYVVNGIVDWPYEVPVNENCMTCHGKEKPKRGFDPSSDVHMVDNSMNCWDCHVRMEEYPTSTHQLAKGCTIDTSMANWWDTMSVAETTCEDCHLDMSDPIHTNAMLTQHSAKIACETCHTGLRKGGGSPFGLASRSWQTFTSGYAGPTGTWHSDGWMPVHKWYDGGGPPPAAPASGHLPILNDWDMMKTWSRVFDAKIFPFNDIEVKWFVKTPASSYDDVIPLSAVKAADQAGDSNLTTSVAEMQAYNSGQYSTATLITDKVCFNVSHSVQPREGAFFCDTCHDSGWDTAKWNDLGYMSGDPMGTTTADLEKSYHGHLGHVNTADLTDHEQGMLEKWCALPDLTIADDSVEGPGSWTVRCGGCHIGGKFGTLNMTLAGDPNSPWERDPVRLTVDCTRCHVKGVSDLEEPTIAKCMSCHGKEVAKRAFDQTKDVHMVDNGMLCHDCHFRFTDSDSDHQLAKGTTIDTSMATAWDTMGGGCSAVGCHDTVSHAIFDPEGTHISKIACETCHTGMRTGGLALKSRRWDKFTSGYAGPTNQKRMDLWMPVHKWYDGGGPPSTPPANGHLPILQPAEMRDNPGAKIYPFNDIEVTWFVKTPTSSYDDVIPLSAVKGADAAGDANLTTTVAEMQAYNSGQYSTATLINDTVCFNVSHSVESSLDCADCHGWANFAMDWNALGYSASGPYSECCSIKLRPLPRSYEAGSKIRIIGDHFGDSEADFGDPRESTYVMFRTGGKSIQFTIRSWSDTEIKVKVPNEGRFESKWGSGCLPLKGRLFMKDGTNKSNRWGVWILAPTP